MRLALGTQFLDQGFAVVAKTQIACGLVFLDACLFCGLGDQRIELTLRTQPQRNRVLRIDVGDVPVAAVADRGNRVARRANQLADLRIRNFRMVAQDPSDSVGLVLPL